MIFGLLRLIKVQKEVFILDCVVNSMGRPMDSPTPPSREVFCDSEYSVLRSMLYFASWNSLDLPQHKPCLLHMPYILEAHTHNHFPFPARVSLSDQEAQR